MGSLTEIEKYAKEKSIPIMQEDGIKFLEDYIKKNKIKTVLEIGSAIGYSAIRMAQIDKNIKITTIERDEERYKEAIKNIDKLKLKNQITIILKDALEYCGILINERKTPIKKIYENLILKLLNIYTIFTKKYYRLIYNTFYFFFNSFIIYLF